MRARKEFRDLQLPSHATRDVRMDSIFHLWDDEAPIRFDGNEGEEDGARVGRWAGVDSGNISQEDSSRRPELTVR